MVDSEFVAVDAETQARLTYLGVMPGPGGEGEQAKPTYRRQGPMRHDCHDGLRRGSRQPDPRADDPLSKEETKALLAKPGARPFEMRGREMKGWLRVDAESVSTMRALEPWVMQSVAFARALPPKEKK